MKVIQLEKLSSELLLSRFEGLSFQIQQLEKHLEPKTPTEYVPKKEVAKMFDVSLVTISDWTKKGILTAYRMGNRVYYKRHELEAALVKINNKIED